MRTGRSICDEIVAYGHENITARHRTTLEVTKDREVTPRGDCIIGVRASKSVRDLSDELRRAIMSAERLNISLELPDYGMSVSFSAEGSERLTLTHERDVVVRKSDFACSRTLAVRSSLAARDLDREFVDLLRDRKTLLMMKIWV
ncbi:DUF371 domain-containing protein [Geoglobus sp.]